jgi:hypothetical protein
MAENEEEKKDKTGWGAILQIIQTLVPALGVFGALCYFLGRLYIDSYYYALGISPKVLTFTPNDYMFSSFNSVIMCLVFSVLFYIYWEWFITAEKARKKPFAEYAKRQVEILLFLVGIFLASAMYYIVFLAWPRAYITGISGLCTGLGLGIVIIAINIIINTKSEQTGKRMKPERTKNGLYILIDKKPEPAGKGSFILQLLISVIVIFSLMPLVAENLAKAQAKSDLKKFPVVEVITSSDLPGRLQDGSTNCTNSVSGRLIIADEKTVYLSSLNVRMGSIEANLAAVAAPEKTEVIFEVFPSSIKAPVIWRQVYAIPTDSIKDIIYYSKE